MGLTGTDTRRAGAALAGPGLDTRTWVSLAVITKIVVDPERGPLADIVLMPSGLEETARIGAVYAGDGFGAWFPPEVEDTVLVEAPSGNPDEGLVISQRLWSKVDKVPATAVDSPGDVLLAIKAGRKLRITVEGEGDAIIAAKGSGKIYLGDSSGTSPVARVDDEVMIRGISVPPHPMDLQTLLDGRYTLRPSPPPLALPPQISGLITTGASKVEAK